MDTITWNLRFFGLSAAHGLFAKRRGSMPTLSSLQPQPPAIPGDAGTAFRAAGNVEISPVEMCEMEQLLVDSTAKCWIKMMDHFGNAKCKWDVLKQIFLESEKHVFWPWSSYVSWVWHGLLVLPLQGINMILVFTFFVVMVGSWNTMRVSRIFHSKPFTLG